MFLPRIPLVAYHNCRNGYAVTPDGGFFYSSFRAVCYVRIKEDGVADIRNFQTRQQISGIDVDPGWQLQDALSPADVENIDPNFTATAETPLQERTLQKRRYFAVLCQDGTMQVWDFDRNMAMCGHKAHVRADKMKEGAMHADSVVMSYMKNRNILTMDSRVLIVYCMASNTYVSRPSFLVFNQKCKSFTAIKCSPRDENIFAVGSTQGYVLICDMQKMQLLYTLHGHSQAITKLIWKEFQPNALEQSSQILQQDAPKISGTTAKQSPKNIATNAQESLKNKKPNLTLNTNTAHETADDDIFNIYEYDYCENEFGAPSSSYTKTATNDDENSPIEFVGLEKPNEGSTNFNFVEACQNLKSDIQDLQTQGDDKKANNEVTLADCQQTECHDDTSCGEDDEEEEQQQADEQHSQPNSLEIMRKVSDSEEEDTDTMPLDGHFLPKHQILHKVELHAEQEAAQDCCEQPKCSATNEQHCLSIADNKNENSADNINSTAENNVSNSLQQANSDMLLASISVDGQLHIWNANKGVSCDSINIGKNNHHNIAWHGSNSLIISTTYRELSCLYVLPNKAAQVNENMLQRYSLKQTKQKLQSKAVVGFALVGDLMWSMTLHGEIMLEQVNTGKMLAKYNSCMQNIAVMRECPDDMNKIAVAYTHLSIYDLSTISNTFVYCDRYNYRHEEPILSLVWSPDSKKLAFGTIDGRIGIVNVEAPRSQPIMLPAICGKAIYSLCWTENIVISVCDENVAFYDTNYPKCQANVWRNMRGASSIACYERNFLIVGTQKGQLQLWFYAPETFGGHLRLNCQLLHTIDASNRYISDIAWSPMQSNRMAVVSNSNIVLVVDFNEQAKKLNKVCKYEIKNSQAANVSVKWSNCTADLFLTCGFDGAIRVWDCKQTNEKFLKQFHSPMLSGLFLPTNEQIIMCSGKSTALEFIDMSVEKSIDYSASKFKRGLNYGLDKLLWAQKATLANDKISLDKRKQRKNKEGNNILAEQGNMQNGIQQLSKMLDDVSLKESGSAIDLTAEPKLNQNNNYETNEKMPQTLLYMTTKELNKDALELLHDMLSNMAVNAPPKRESSCRKLFGTKTDIKFLLEQELCRQQHASTKTICNIFVSQLNGDIKQEIVKHIQNKQLTDWHVSLAPTVSYNFWQKCCHAYAEQLLEQGFGLKAATYIMALHQHREAIDMLLHAKYHKEALLVAKSYLQANDPKIMQIVDNWIDQLETVGNLMGAAYICGLSKNYQRASELLTRIRNTQPEIERVIKLLNEVHSMK